MDLVKVLENFDKISKEGVPLNHSVEKETLKTAGSYIFGGLVACGFIVGLIVGGVILFTNK